MRYVVWLEDHNEWKFCLKDQPYFFMHLRFYEIYFLLPISYLKSLINMSWKLTSCMKTRMLFQKLIQLILHLAWTDRIMFLLMSSIEINEQIIEHLHDLWGPDLLMLCIGIKDEQSESSLSQSRLTKVSKSCFFDGQSTYLT